MTRSDILSLFTDCLFDGELTEYNYPYKVLSHLPSSFVCENFIGVSKLVLVPADEDLKFVIKIPFNGREDGDYYHYEEEEEEEYSSIFSPFECANADYTQNWDYCFAEVLQYREAKKWGLSSIFAKTSLLGYMHDHPIYIQERASSLYESKNIIHRRHSSTFDGISKELLHSSKHSFGGDGESREHTAWMEDVYNYNGKSIFNKFLIFLERTGMNDIHNNNIGYIGNRPVIFDYSSWND